MKKTSLNAYPHIELKLKKKVKRNNTTYNMLNKSGCGWDDTFKFIEIDNNKTWKALVQVLIINILSN